MGLMLLYSLAMSARVSYAQIGGDPVTEGDNEEPIPCPASIAPSGFFQNIWFNSVPMNMDGNPSGGNVANYKVIGTPISANRKWMWFNGGGTFRCSRTWIVPGVFYVDGQFVVPPSDGVMLPTNEEEITPGGPSSGGRGREIVTITFTETYVCYVTDWYENGVYTNTTVDYCTVE